ncbi:MAG: AAA family ATPase [Patescibacteria group bacterium]
MELTEELFKKMYEEHKRQLKYLEYPNKKLIVTFSGTFGSGKSTLAKLIEERFKAIRINNDDIRSIINSVANPQTNGERQEILIEYNKRLFGYGSQEDNGLIILDASVDREYKLVQKLAEKYGYKIFVVRMDLAKETLINRIKKRNISVESFLKRFEENYNDFQTIKDKITPNYIITEQNNDDAQALFEAIKSFLRK